MEPITDQIHFTADSVNAIRTSEAGKVVGAPKIVRVTKFSQMSPVAIADPPDHLTHRHPSQPGGDAAAPRCYPPPGTKRCSLSSGRSALLPAGLAVARTTTAHALPSLADSTRN